MQGPFYLDILTADEDHAVIMFEVGKLSEEQMDQFQGGTWRRSPHGIYFTAAKLGPRPGEVRVIAVN